MMLYGVALMPLAKKIQAAVPEAMKPWFADDLGAAGRAEHNARCLDFLLKTGPWYGFYPKPSKCVYICKAEDEARARKEFEKLKLQIDYS
jgi:hypothetical protein